MKSTLFICLLVVTIVSTSYVDTKNNGLLIQAETPIQLRQCPTYDDPNHIVMLPYPNDCSKYYTCFKGLAYAFQCPDNYYWSQLTYRCDQKQYSNCQNNDYPDQSIQYSAYPGDCSRYYETRILRCRDNYHWNAQLQRCDPPQFAGCELYPYPVPPYDPISSLVPTAATPFPINRPTAQPGYFAPIDPEYVCKTTVGTKYVPYPGDCHKFIYCGQTATVLTCADLYWNPNTQSCSPSNSGCILNH